MIENIKNMKYNAWYRGLKEISFLKEYRNTLYMSNGDKIKIINNDIYLNNELITNDNISFDEFEYIYKTNLKQRGYKII